MRDSSKNIARSRQMDYGVNDKMAHTTIRYGVLYGGGNDEALMKLLEGLKAKPKTNP